MHSRPSIAGLMLSVSLSATAADWVALGLDNGGNAWHIDRASIVREVDRVSVWKRIALREPPPRFGDADPAVKVALVLDVTDCSQRQVDVKALKLLDADGAVVATRERGEQGIKLPVGGHVMVQEKAVTLLCSDAWRDN